MEVNPFQITYQYGIQRELLSQAIYTDIDQEKPAINYHYTYDGLLRLRKVSAYEKNFSNKIRTLVTYDYDDVTGNLINKKQLLSKELTSTDYIHDVRNRLTSISTIGLETFDMFEQTLLYDNQLASMEVDNALHFVSSGYSYNGNIRAVQTSYHLDAVGFHDSPSNFDFPTLYGYTYDKMNRLTKADALVGDFIHNSSQISNAIKIGDEAYQFDKIGNIKRLARTIAYSSNNSPDISKDEGWVYKYNLKNQLTMLSPTTNTVSSKAYTYDLNGNLKSDNARNLNQMTYGKSTYIYKLEQDSKKINYLYDSDDMRFYKKTQLSQNANDLLEELYIYDISGKLVAIKKMPSSQAAEYSYYLNGGSKEACLSSLNGDGDINNGEITFFLEDYLGNTRISYEPVSVVISNIPYEKLKINYVADYFPYGKILREYVNTASGNPEKFLTSQHERDLESGLDYRGARFYDNDIARFLSLDPMQIERLSLTPYNYVSGNPIIRVDPTGKLDGNYYDEETGEYLGTDGVNDNYEHTISKSNWEFANNHLSHESSSYWRRDRWTTLTSGFSSTGEISSNFQAFKSKYGVAGGGNTPWVRIAEAELGVKEIKGTSHNSRILEYHASTSLGAKTDEVPWCASFLTWTFTQMGMKGAGASSQAWKGWGQNLGKTPAYGSVGIISNGDGTGHVGLVVGMNQSGNIILLGGNQSDMVKYSAFKSSSFTRFVYPDGYTPTYDLPTLQVTGTTSYTQTR